MTFEQWENKFYLLLEDMGWEDYENEEHDIVGMYIEGVRSHKFETHNEYLDWMFTDLVAEYVAEGLIEPMPEEDE